MGYDYIIIEDGDHILNEGYPEIPVIRKNIILHPEAINVSINVLDSKKDTIRGYYRPPPVQKPAILSRITYEIPEKVNENKNIYNSNKLYPPNNIELKKTGNLRGLKSCGILFFPFQWIPSTGKLILTNEITIEIKYNIKRKTLPQNYSMIDLQIIHKFYENSFETEGVIKENPAAIDYIVITSPNLTDEFQPLVKWKCEKGLKSKMVTTDSIYNQYLGLDNQEKIRNFIKDMYQNYGVQWILLGGDNDIVPSRIGFAMSSEAGIMSDEDSLRADLYYSDLDGNWNADGHFPCGELEDSIDLYPDVFVGRVPVNSKIEVANFVNKLIQYEKNPPVSYLEEALFLGEILWSDPYTDASVGKDKIDSLYIPNWINITKLYESLGNENPATVINALNNGKNLVNHNGHAWYNLMGVGDGYLYRSDVDALNNANMPSIIFSIGCWAAAFDYDAIAERFIENSDGGGIAFIGNSRYGWGSPGHPGFGYSDRFDAAFFDFLFEAGFQNIGLALSMAKASFIPRSRAENVYRWHQYQLNLLGDPEMPVWLKKPDYLLIELQDSIIDSIPFTLRITDTLKNPLADVRVCISELNTVIPDNSLWERSYTNQFGECTFLIESDYPCSLLVTAVKNNFIPEQDTIILLSSGAYLSLENFEMHERTGNNDGIVNPGELIEIWTTMKNTGNVMIDNIDLYLRTINEYINITDSSFYFSDTLYADSIFSCDFSFIVDSTLTEQTSANFELTGYSNLKSWKNIFSEFIGIPELKIIKESISLSGNDSIPNGGDYISCHYKIKNEGNGNAYGLNITFHAKDTLIIITDSLKIIDTLLSGNEIRDTLSIYLSPSIVEPQKSWIKSHVATIDSYVFIDSFFIKIGESGFFDNLESGLLKWEHYGTNDLWHLSNFRSYSGSYSLYPGLDSNHQYLDSMNAVLRTSQFKIFPPCTLSFYHWYEFPNYGNDGLLIIVEHDSIMDTLDYIGSGGALDSTLTIGNTWIKEEYNISYINPGSNIRIYFSFISDLQDHAEGIYIDDIRITGSKIFSECFPLEERPLLEIPSTVIFNTQWIFVSVNEISSATMQLFDRSGRLVKNLLENERLTIGIHPVKIPPGLPCGIYFIQLKVNDLKETRKLVILR